MKWKVRIAYVLVAAGLGAAALSACGKDKTGQAPESVLPHPEPIPAPAQPQPAQEPAAPPEPEEEIPPRGEQDAGEDDGDHPMDVPITEGKADQDYPSCPIGDLGDNPDTRGILYIPCIGLGSRVQWREYDDDYYLEHNEDQEASISGSIEIDGWNDPDLTDVDSIFYGHNMADYSMFGSLKNMAANPKIVEEDPYIYFYDRESVKCYRIFSFYITTSSDPAYELAELEYPAENDIRDLPDDMVVGEEGRTLKEIVEMEGLQAALDQVPVYAAEDAYRLQNDWYDDFVAAAMEDSLWTPEEKPDFSLRPRTILLATCHGQAHGDGRLLVHAVLEHEYLRDDVEPLADSTNALLK